jgi:hypothetical protein
LFVTPWLRLLRLPFCEGTIEEEDDVNATKKDLARNG